MTVLASHLVNERLAFALLVDISAHLNQTLGHHCVSVHAGFFQHAVVKLRVAPHLGQSQTHRLPQLKQQQKTEPGV